jgi:hypothetical protein
MTGTNSRQNRWTSPRKDRRTNPNQGVTNPKRGRG